MDLNVVAFIFLLATVFVFLISVFFYGANSFNGTRNENFARVYKVGFTLSIVFAVVTFAVIAVFLAL